MVQRTILTSTVVGGSDVFVDIGDKSWGVLSCQRFLGGIEGSKTLHVSRISVFECTQRSDDMPWRENLFRHKSWFKFLS